MTEKLAKDTILVVHSDPQIRGLFETKNIPYAKILTASPEEAMDVYTAKGIVIGAVIANSDGMDFARKVREVDPSLPVVGYSVKPEVKTMIEALAGENNRFIASDGPASIDAVIGQAKRMMEFSERLTKWTSGLGEVRKGKWI